MELKMMLKLFEFWIKTAFLFLIRAARSTVVLSLMVVIAVTSLIFLSSLAVGVNDAMIRNSVSLYSGHISGFGLPSGLKTENLLIEGVASVLKRISIPMILSYQNHIETVSLIGVDPSKESKTTALWKKIIDGKYIQNSERSILLGQQLAERLKVKPGAVVDFGVEPEKYEHQLKVSGIYKTGIMKAMGVTAREITFLIVMEVFWLNLAAILMVWALSEVYR
jgi:ABC-type lipoprotein release transport system permease subunit